MSKSKLIEFRESRNLTRYRVAKDIGVSNNVLARLEDPGTPKIDRELVRKLVEYYGPDLTLAHLLT